MKFETLSTESKSSLRKLVGKTIRSLSLLIEEDMNCEIHDIFPHETAAILNTLHCARYGIEDMFKIIECGFLDKTEK